MASAVSSDGSQRESRTASARVQARTPRAWQGLSAPSEIRESARSEAGPGEGSRDGFAFQRISTFVTS